MDGVCRDIFCLYGNRFNRKATSLDSLRLKTNLKKSEYMNFSLFAPFPSSRDLCVPIASRAVLSFIVYHVNIFVYLNPKLILNH